ncbi:immunity protein TriTu family protein [Nostoc sp.]|uniref:immunity protein TriTu family protein n=1 Tax=Nostoc sp. TaxID=1180 RepID=UPI002FFB31E9
MSLDPLTQLISERGFDRFQPGLRSRFAAYRLGYTLTYCEPTDNSAMRLDFESSLHLGRVTVWESGACEMDILEISTGNNVFYESHQFKNEKEFHHTLPRLVIFMRDMLRLQSDDI